MIKQKQRTTACTRYNSKNGIIVKPPPTPFVASHSRAVPVVIFDYNYATKGVGGGQALPNS